MSDAARTDVESLMRVREAISDYQKATTDYAHRSAWILDTFESQVMLEQKDIEERIDTIRGNSSELDQMMPDYVDQTDELRRFESTYDQLSDLLKEYRVNREVLSSLITRLLKGETINGNMHGLSEVIRLLQDYLGN